MSIESVMPSSHLILCRSLLLLPPILSNICMTTSPFLICSGMVFCTRLWHFPSLDHCCPHHLTALNAFFMMEHTRSSFPAELFLEGPSCLLCSFPIDISQLPFKTKVPWSLRTLLRYPYLCPLCF